jgi:hypothetical protein
VKNPPSGTFSVILTHTSPGYSGLLILMVAHQPPCNNFFQHTPAVRQGCCSHTARPVLDGSRYLVVSAFIHVDHCPFRSDSTDSCYSCYPFVSVLLTPTGSYRIAPAVAPLFIFTWLAHRPPDWTPMGYQFIQFTLRVSCCPLDWTPTDS